MGSFEYYRTSSSCMDNETSDERFVGVPEEGGRDLIATDPLVPGSVYTATVDNQARSWISVGWEVAKVNLAKSWVLFILS